MFKLQFLLFWTLHLYRIDHFTDGVTYYPNVVDDVTFTSLGAELWRSHL
jgi:hypothetical protein